MNRKPLAERQIYHDIDTCVTCRHKLAVYYLQVGNDLPAKDEYEKLPNRPQVIAALTVIDTLLMEGFPIPKNRAESFNHKGIKLWEIKAPQRGKMISRLLAYRESEWNMFVALARQKKSQELRDSWKDTASDRVKRALSEGGSL